MYKSIVRYLLFYVTIAVLYTLWSYLLDLYFVYFEFGSLKGYTPVGFEYFIWFIVGYSIISFSACVFYNLFMNHFLEGMKLWIKIIVAVLIGIAIGNFIGKNGVSYYVGPKESIKAILLYPLIA